MTEAMGKNLRAALAACAASAAMSIAMSAHAQTTAAASTAPAASATPAAETAGLEEIVVTAQRKSENLQKVPISVQAISAAQLSSRGGISATDLTALVPGLVLPQSVGAGTPFLRGSGNVTIVGGENAVAFYIDGIFLQLPSNNLMSFNNIERVEVLKGPQGTLFGRNATGGLIQVITRDPSQTTRIDANIGYGSYNDLTANIFATGSLAPNVAASIALTGQKRFDGWGKNYGTGNDLFKAENFGIQNKFLFTDDSGKLSLLTNVIYSNRKTSEGEVLGIVPGTFSPNKLWGNVGQYDINVPAFDPLAKGHQTIASAKLKYSFDWGQISDMVAYEESRTKLQMDLNSVPRALSAAVVPILYYLDSRDKTWTNELQLQSAPGSKLQWVMGAFYMWNKSDADNQVYSTFNGIGNFPALTFKIDDGGNRIRSYAGYAQASYPIVEDTHLTVGLRYSVDQKRFYVLRTAYNAAGVVTSVQTQNSFINAAVPVIPNKKWEKLTERVSLDHQFTPNLMGYVAFNTGFKGGQYSTLSPSNPAASPEKVTAYTAGFKSELFGRRLRFNVEGFYNKLRDIQLKAILTQGAAAVVYNATSGTSKGVDIDFEALLTRGLTLSGGAEYLNARYGRFPNANCFQELPTGGIGPVGNGTCDVSGSTMIRSPKLSMNAALRYDWELSSGGKIGFQVGDGYNSGFFWDPDHLVKQKKYHNVSASATWTSSDRHYQLSVWGKNITGSHIWASAQNATPYEVYNPGQPALFGGTFSFHY